MNAPVLNDAPASVAAPDVSQAFPPIPIPDYMRRPLTVADIFKMAEVGIFAPGERVELIDGQLLHKRVPIERAKGAKGANGWADFTEEQTTQMAPIGYPHALTVMLLERKIRELIGWEPFLSIQGPLHLDASTYVEPDLLILGLVPQPPDKNPIRPDNVIWLAEVADSTLKTDRNSKIPLYARHGIPEVWLFDLNARSVAVYRDPKGGAYASVTQHGTDATIAPTLLPAMLIQLDTIFN